ncbi:hypothetical protein VE01_00528 [Pseudogymnoascus verrucosus]|uniref:Aquaporin n=1 Tax=Pseudogymnoascus verrucosus TaxID=342668 RepID=A0A2P2SYF1_9PEZI|nr:uncharacterized protein VE01_00528 [Pseudogymnoascus verrucosus]OBU01860.1 hypothetical protein VE01_00528 [Pseudogymnoascus verrucosus]
MSSDQNLQERKLPGCNGPIIRDPDEKIATPNRGHAKHFENATSEVIASPISKNQDADLSVGKEEGGRATVLQEEFKEREKQISHLRERVGLSEDPHIRPEQESTNRFSWPSFRVVFREPFAEFFGTMVMVMFGNGSVAQVLLGGGEINAPRKNGYGSYQGINWGWGIGIFFGIYIAGDSGCYLNPAITMGFCLFRKLPWRRCPIYFLAQCLGGFVGAGVVYANNVNGIDKFEGHGIRNVPPSPTTIAAIFCTYPQPFLAKTSQFVSEFVASSILMFAIFALKDVSNPGAMGKSGPGPLFPLGLFFLIFGLGAAFGWDTGYAINLARDFGPRLMSYILGYGPGVWSAGGYYFWIPMVAPFCGCAFGGFLYDAFIYTGSESRLNRQWWGLKELYDNRHRLMKRGHLNSRKHEV